MWQAVASVKSFRERRAWLVGAISLIVLVAGVTFAFSLNKLPALRGVYSISADLKDAAGVESGNEVRIAGVRVGRVTSVHLTPTAARITMEIQRDVHIPQESRLAVKLATLLGQKFIDIEMPDAYLRAVQNGSDPSQATHGYLSDGDVIPRSQTSIPYEIYQAANQGTQVLSKIDEHSLRRLLEVVGHIAGTSKQELRRALTGVDRVGKVLDRNGAAISRLLRNASSVSGILAHNDRNIDAILSRASDVLDTLAARRRTITTLLSATNGLGRNLGLLIAATRNSIHAGSLDLDSVVASVQTQLRSIDKSLARLGVAGQLLGRPLTFGRFVEGNVCAITSEDTCVPEGSPENPGLPVHDVQPTPTTRAPRHGGAQ